jgi:peptidoglycan-associated lipoprotein
MTPARHLGPAFFVAAALLLAGCGEQPAGRVIGVGPSEFQHLIGDRVFFEVDSVRLDARSRETLDRQAAWLKRYTNYAITVEGHADERGTREYNLALGARRAQMIASYLAAQGVPPARLKITSYGKERPEVVGSDEGAWSRNRRGVTTLQ